MADHERRTAPNTPILAKTPTKARNPSKPPKQAGALEATEPTKPGAASTRALRAAGRRAAIVDAALEEFTARGYAATRLEDVASRAGVAKGTIYLHFADKEALFQELLRSALLPLIERISSPPLPDVSARAMLENFAQIFVREVTQTRRADLLRLMMAEGPRFPSLAEFHYREIVERGLTAIRAVICHGIQRGEIRHDALQRFPQLVMAPAMLTVLWQGLFGRYAPLDALGMLRAHIDIIFDEGKAT
ncbi:helix-turn-helix transcriptional regulator [Rhodopseudomonas palustris]|uniref:Transcriptional regulator, TetR family n=1 Tax=Rhodopseudomonas palustris (strain BisB5) TaxID=316057 RepID=Q13A62_RHOPS|nr:transcriptional regulator, TetR family [Rhodopseudomonas palustris BisB5]MBB1091146.1 helix-turn-helix transcriptional regulator [Rhodopseudomonas palustris]